MDSNGTLDGLALQTRDLLLSLAVPDLAPFLADWPHSVRRYPTVHDAKAAGVTGSSFLPVLRWMPDFACDEHHVGAAVIEGLLRTAESLAWRQTYTAKELGDEFLRNYGWTEILGPHAPITNPRIACGFLLLGPATLYPRHHHEAEEVYIPLSGTANWQQGDAVWRERLPGAVIHHASGEPHAMQTGARPLLALYLWRSDDLNQKAQLELPSIQ